MKCTLGGCGNNKGRGIACTRRSASNLLHHVGKCHKAMLDTVQRHVGKRNQPQLAASSSKEGPMDAHLKKSTKVQKPAHTDASTVESCAKLIVTEIMPVSLVARPGFIQFVEELRPDVKLPSVKTLVKGIQVSDIN